MPNSDSFSKSVAEMEKTAAQNSIGKMLMSGIGVGIEQNSYLAVTSMEKVYVELDTLTKNSAKNAQALDKKRREREVENLKNALKLELISEQEYYEKLREFRDANLRQGSDDWYKYTEEIIFYNKRMADEAEAAQAAAIEETKRKQQQAVEYVLSLQGELEEKLKDHESPWYEYTQTIIKGIGKNGSDAVYSNTYLSDFEEEISLLTRYRDAIVALQGMGTIPEGVFAEIGAMGVSEGLSAAEAILGADPEALAGFISGYTEKSALAESVSKELLPYLEGEKLREAGIDASKAFCDAYFMTEDGEKAEFIKLLEESFEEVPKSYYDLGASSADSFEKGFSEALPAALERLRVSMSASVSTLAADISGVFNRVLTQGASAGSTTTYTNTYNFNTSSDTTTQQLFAAKRAAALQKMRGGE